jgi:hypothetical protein
MVGGLYDRLQRAEAALREANKILVAIVGAMRRYGKVAEAVQRSRERLVSVYATPDRRVHVVGLRLPGSRPTIIGVYVSTQVSRPASPAQILNRIRRLTSKVREVKGGEPADVVLLYVTPKRVTRGAFRVAMRLGVMVARSGSEARRRLASLFLKRYRSLVKKLIGKKVWGKVPLLVYALGLLAKELGAAELELPSSANIIEWAERGYRLSAGEIFLKETPPP